MLRILDVDEQIELSWRDAEKMYPKQRFLLVDTKHENCDVVGRIYAISEDPSSLRDLVDLETQIQDEGKKAFIGGDYYDSDCVISSIWVVEE